jgi:Flp pilus assembly pilin Flp
VSCVVMESPVIGDEETQELIASDTERGRSMARGPAAWLAVLLGWMMSPVSRDQRGVTTIEYLFGAILAIAIVTVALTVFRRPETADLFQKVIEFVLKFRGK